MKIQDVQGLDRTAQDMASVTVRRTSVSVRTDGLVTAAIFLTVLGTRTVRTRVRKEYLILT